MSTNRNSSRTPGLQDFERELLSKIPALRAFALSLTRSSDKANDLVQDTLEKALRARESFTPGSNLKAWLWTIARNRHVSNFRSARGFLPLDPEVIERTLTNDEEVPEAEAQDNFRKFLLCLLCLPAEFGDALIAIGYLDMSYEEASQRFGIPVGTLKSRVYRARQDIQKWIENDAEIQADVSVMQQATKHVLPNHPLFPIAKAYEELYAAFGPQGPVEPAQRDLVEETLKKLTRDGALDGYDDYDEYGH